MHPAGLKDAVSSLVVAEELDELVRELRSPQLDGQCGIESFEMADEGVVLQYPGQECGMIGSASCDGSAAGYAGINIQVNQVPVILGDEEWVGRK